MIMRVLKGFAAGSLAFCAVVALSACATKVVGLQHDPSFTYGAIVSSKTAVGGVISAVDIFSESKITSASTILRDQFVDRRNEFAIERSGVIVNAMGKKKYLQMLDEYKNTGTLSAQWMNAVRSVAGDVRYVIFARIEEDVINPQRTKQDTYTKDKDGKKYKTGELITSKISRNTTVSLNIYDLDQSSAVWGGSVSKTQSKQRTYNVSLSSSLDKVVVVLGSVLSTEDKRFPYPPTPSQNDILKAVFRGFADNLPKKEK